MSQDAIMITLKLSDNQTFEVAQSVAFESKMLKDMTEDKGAGSIIPVCEVPGKLLAMILQYCEYHAGLRKKSSDEKPTVSEEEIKKWNAEFIRVHDLTTRSNVCALIEAADYLNIESLLELGAQICADKINNMSPEEIRVYWGVPNDFSEEEEREIRRENQWVLE